MTTIVIAVISFVVLFIVIIFFTGGFGKIFGQAKAAIGSVEADVSAAQTKCSQWCLQAQNLGSTNHAKSSWCTKTQPIDNSGDGIIGTDEKYKCADTTINAVCPGVTCT